LVRGVSAVSAATMAIAWLIGSEMKAAVTVTAMRA
jgi:phage gp46-like protein